MNTKELISTVKALLNDVIVGKKSYRELQTFVDRVIAKDELPPDITSLSLRCIYDLQLDLALIAEHQDTYAATSSYYSQEEVAQILQKHSNLLRESASRLG